MLMILLSTLNIIWYLIWATTRIGFWTWIWSLRHCRLGQKVACWFQCWKNSASSFDQSNNTGAIVCSWGKKSFEMLGSTFSCKFDCGSYIIFIAKTASKKIGALIRSIKFLSPEVAVSLQIYHTTMHEILLPYLGWFS